MKYLHQYVGSSRLALARERATQAVARWSARWRMDDLADPLVVAAGSHDTDTSTSAATATWAGALRASDSRGTLLARATDDAWRRLVFGGGADRLPDDAVARTLLTQAQQALLAELAAAPGQPAATAPAFDRPATEPAAGRARIALSLRAGPDSAPVQVDILVDACRYDDALAASAAPRAALTRRQDAIGHGTVALSLTFPLAQISAEDLQHLRPGVVVRAAQPLEQPLQLGTEQAPAALAAYLGQAGIHKAVRITALPRSTPRP